MFEDVTVYPIALAPGLLMNVIETNSVIPLVTVISVLPMTFAPPLEVAGAIVRTDEESVVMTYPK